MIVVVNDPASARLLGSHPRLTEAVHDNLDPAWCSCRAVPKVVERPPNMTGDTCQSCGGMMIRTGSCGTCTQCGWSGGCG